MIKIIEDGKKEFVAVCRRCCCKYSYEVEDIVGDYVTCPYCGYVYAWKHDSKQVTHIANAFYIPVDTGDIKPV